MRRVLRLCLWVGLPLLLIPALLPKKVSAKRQTESDASTGPRARAALLARERKAQDVVDRVRTRLAIPESVVVSVVPEDKLVVSITRLKDRDGAFALSFEAGFLDLLTKDEFEAVVAHELGHVWIFTHHPYLQTEELANQIAMRVVARETLERAYEKVWKRIGRRSEVAYLPPAE